jgi:hypothetical protein
MMYAVIVAPVSVEAVQVRFVWVLDTLTAESAPGAAGGEARAVALSTKPIAANVQRILFARGVILGSVSSDYEY